MLKLIVILILIWVVGTVILGLCEDAGNGARMEEEIIEKEFISYKWCDDDCYMCDNQGMCERAITKEGQDVR